MDKSKRIVRIVKGYKEGTSLGEYSQEEQDKPGVNIIIGVSY